MRQEVGETRMSESGDQLVLDGKGYRISFEIREPSEPGYGYTVDTYKFRDDDSRDLAKATVAPHSTTPPQVVLTDGLIADYPIKGRGIFICFTPMGVLEIINFNSAEPSQRNFKVTYSRGFYQCWKAGAEGLEFLEVCSPPYKTGDFKNLDFKNDYVPRNFKTVYQALANF